MWHVLMVKVYFRFGKLMLYRMWPMCFESTQTNWGARGHPSDSSPIAYPKLNQYYQDQPSMTSEVQEAPECLRWCSQVCYLQEEGPPSCGHSPRLWQGTLHSFLPAHQRIHESLPLWRQCASSYFLCIFMHSTLEIGDHWFLKPLMGGNGWDRNFAFH